MKAALCHCALWPYLYRFVMFCPKEVNQWKGSLVIGNPVKTEFFRISDQRSRTYVVLGGTFRGLRSERVLSYEALQVDGRMIVLRGAWVRSVYAGHIFRMAC